MNQLNPARQLVYDLKQAMPNAAQRENFQSLLGLFLQATGNIRLSHSQGKSASSLSRFLNHYSWSSKGLWAQLRRLQLERLLNCRSKGRRPSLQVMVDLTSLEKTGEFPELEPYIHTLDGKRGVHLVVVYLVLGNCRVPWSLRLWQGAGAASSVQLALGQLKQLPSCLRQGYRLMVLGDGGFGTVDFLQGVKNLEMPAVVTMRADRRLEDKRQLREIRGCEAVRPTGLGLTVWAARLRLKGTDGQPGVWRHVVSTRALSSKMIKRWGRRRFAIEGFFKVIKHRFGLHCFGQCTRLGVYRWFMFSLLAYSLAYQAHLDSHGDEQPDWQAASQQALRSFLPEYLMMWALVQVEKLAALGQSLGFEVQLCNCKI
jgi:hypothetical protein